MVERVGEHGALVLPRPTEHPNVVHVAVRVRETIQDDAEGELRGRGVAETKVDCAEAEVTKKLGDLALCEPEVADTIHIGHVVERELKRLILDGGPIHHPTLGRSHGQQDCNKCNDDDSLWDIHGCCLMLATRWEVQRAMMGSEHACAGKVHHKPVERATE